MCDYDFDIDFAHLCGKGFSYKKIENRLVVFYKNKPVKLFRLEDIENQQKDDILKPLRKEIRAGKFMLKKAKELGLKTIDYDPDYKAVEADFALLEKLQRSPPPFTVSPSYKLHEKYLENNYE